MLDPLDMLVFAKVVETSSFSTAARRLGMSRSAASKHVTRLERTLAVRLLNRTTRKLSLTEAGHSVYAHSTRIASEVDAPPRLRSSRSCAALRVFCALARPVRSVGFIWCRSCRIISRFIPTFRSSSC